jgi:hypothetical protein
MSWIETFTGGSAFLPTPDAETQTRYVLTQHPLRRIMAFTGRSIDDVVNDPIARNEVLGYYRLHRQIERSGEILELEKQWNPLG